MICQGIDLLSVSLSQQTGSQAVMDQMCRELELAKHSKYWVVTP